MPYLKKLIYQVISDEIPKKAKVLDLGCGSGTLLRHLISTKRVIGHGVDINSNRIVDCIEKGIPVIQLDINNIPLDFPDKSYDIVILNQTLQEVHPPKGIINEILRIGKEAILGFPNFGNLFLRTKFVISGRMPVSKELPYHWYNTPNIHLLTIKDFYDFCSGNDINIIKQVFLKRKFRSNRYKRVSIFNNARADLAMFRIKKG